MLDRGNNLVEVEVAGERVQATRATPEDAVEAARLAGLVPLRPGDNISLLDADGSHLAPGEAPLLFAEEAEAERLRQWGFVPA